MRALLVRALLVLCIFSVPNLLFGACYDVNDRNHSCRYPQGDNWCNKNNLPPYAYLDACEPLSFERVESSRSNQQSANVYENRTESHPETPENCGPTPRDFEQNEYGDALYSITSPCNRTLSPKEQVFVAGMSQHLLEHCKYPKDLESRLKLQRFLTSSAFVGTIGRQYGNPNLGQGLRDQAASATALAAGAATAKAIGCNDTGEHLARVVVDYLDRTAKSSPSAPSYVEGCARYYSGRYTEQQCRCVADIGRSVFPNIHQTSFSPASIKQIIQSNPFVGLQIAFQCQIGDY